MMRVTSHLMRMLGSVRRTSRASRAQAASRTEAPLGTIHPSTTGALASVCPHHTKPCLEQRIAHRASHDRHMSHVESVKKLGRRNLQSLKRWRCHADADLVPLLDTAGQGVLRAAMQRGRCELKQKRRTVRFTRLRSALLLLLDGVQGSIHVHGYPGYVVLLSKQALKCMIQQALSQRALLVASTTIVKKSLSTAEHEKLKEQAEAGELLGLQRLYVCTALSNQPNGGLAEPLKVRDAV